MSKLIEWLWKEADKVCHAFLHATIIMALSLGFGVGIWICWIVSEIWGFGYEIIIQWLTKGKEKLDWRDIIANNVGMLYGTVVWIVVVVVRSLLGL